ncbi:Uncharacterised protein [Mycobacteroides abscessus subsp. abscessus]|nr:Uncharacterised protein [Mycobacteroides abscessus subsp. abscessus]
MTDLGLQTGLGDHLGQRQGSPRLIHDHRDARARSADHHLTRPGQQSRQIGDLGRHRLGGKEGQLAHSH